MEDELLELLSDTVTIAAPDGTYTDRGQVNYAAGTSYPCRIEPAGSPGSPSGEEIIRSPSGEAIEASWRLIIGTEDTIDHLSQITLPSGYDPQTPPVLAVGRVPDENGSHHTVILV